MIEIRLIRIQMISDVSGEIRVTDTPCSKVVRNI